MKFSSKEAQNSRSGGHHLGELLAAWWQACDVNALNLSLLNHSKLLVSSFRSCTRRHGRKKHNPKMLSDLICLSRTRQQAARNSPRWRPPILEFRATLDENFIGLESSLEAEILVSNLPLCNLFVTEKKKTCSKKFKSESYPLQLSTKELKVSWLSNRTGTSINDGKARGKDWTWPPLRNLPFCH